MDAVQATMEIPAALTDPPREDEHASLDLDASAIADALQLVRLSESVFFLSSGTIWTTEGQSLSQALSKFTKLVRCLFVLRAVFALLSPA